MNEICLLNDSFPPAIDGVANTVVNYARVLGENDIPVSVITPKYPGSDDSKFPYDVIRYSSVDLRKMIGYTAGVPASYKVMLDLKDRNIGLLHSHCPASSNLLARSLRESLDVPFVMTYHTKFDIDIKNIFDTHLMQEGVMRALVDNVTACDEVWAVSRGAGENLQKMGYQGDFYVMENGVDIPKQTLSLDVIDKYTKKYNFNDDVPIFLFVGRMMWYKGIKIILDALSALNSQDHNFKMIFIGGGGDIEEIKKYASSVNLQNKCMFLGPIYDREELSAWYQKADLFLFPSTYDTNGLVVREAAACSLASVLVRGSCAAEGVTNRGNCLLIEENAASLAVCLLDVMYDKKKMKNLGISAGNELYISWDDAISKAIKRYEYIIERYKEGKYPKHKSMTDIMFKMEANLDEALSTVRDGRRNMNMMIDRYI